jgi:hypothetical protein
LNKLKSEIGPINTFDFVDLVLHNNDINLIQDFQKKFNLKSDPSLLHVFNFLRCREFDYSTFTENAIYLVKMNKCRKNSQATVNKLVSKFSIPWLKKISPHNAKLLERSNNSIPERMKRPVG